MAADLRNGMMQSLAQGSLYLNRAASQFAGALGAMSMLEPSSESVEEWLGQVAEDTAKVASNVIVVRNKLARQESTDDADHSDVEA